MKHILLIHSVRISLEDDDTTRTVLLNGTSRFAIELIDTEYHSDEVEGVGECMRHCKIQRNTHYTCTSHQNEYVLCSKGDNKVQYYMRDVDVSIIYFMAESSSNPYISEN